MIFLFDSQSQNDFLEHADSLLVGRDVYSVGKFRRGFNEKNLANFAKLSCTIELRLCANATLGRLYFFCITR